MTNYKPWGGLGHREAQKTLANRHPPVEPALYHCGSPTVAGEGRGTRPHDPAAAAGLSRPPDCVLAQGILPLVSPPHHGEVTRPWAAVGVQHDTIQHNTTQHNTTQHNTTQHNTTQHNTTQHNTTQHNTTQHNTTQHNTTQHNTTQHNTTQHNTTQHKTTQHKTSTRHNESNPSQYNTIRMRQYSAQPTTDTHVTPHSTTQEDLVLFPFKSHLIHHPILRNNISCCGLLHRKNE